MPENEGMPENAGLNEIKRPNWICNKATQSGT
jgi:hypothetical protein